LIEETRILKATTVIFILTLITKALQIIFFLLVAAFFGTSGEFESFIVALSIPTFVSSIFLSGFGTAFIPIFARQRLKHGEKSAWEFTSSLINIVLLATIIITIIGIILSPYLIHFMVPGMESVYKYIGIRLTQLLFVTVIFFTLTVILTAVLQSYQSFIVPAAATLISNLVIVATVLVVKQKIGVYVLAVAFILSGACSVVLLLMASKRLWRGGYNFKINFKQLVIKDALLMLIAVSFIGVLGQIILIANRFFASFLPTGSIATMEYASRAVFLIIELLALSVVAPLYQRMSGEAAMDDKAKLRATLSLGMKMTAVILLPIAAFTVLLRVPLFALLLEHGKFTSQNTIEVSSVFFYLSMVIVGSGFGQIIVSTYYAIKKAKLLLILSICGVMLNIILDAVLVRPMGVEGLALATGVSAILGTIFTFWVLLKKIGGLDRIYLSKFMLKTSLASVISGVSGWFLFLYIDNFIKGNLVGQIIKLGVSAIVCMAMYTLLMSFFRMGEINLVLNIFKGRFKIARTGSDE
jgi:putative peptidoglycan lipid II flippase